MVSGSLRKREKFYLCCKVLSAPSVLLLCKLDLREVSYYVSPTAAQITLIWRENTSYMFFCVYLTLWSSHFVFWMISRQSINIIIWLHIYWSIVSVHLHIRNEINEEGQWTNYKGTCLTMCHQRYQQLRRWKLYEIHNKHLKLNHRFTDTVSVLSLPVSVTLVQRKLRRMLWLSAIFKALLFKLDLQEVSNTMFHKQIT